jgi:prepilin-type processing-associated H-X9-DG protein
LPEKFVFVARGQPEVKKGLGFNGNTWKFYLNTLTRWGDPFAILHNDRSTLGYADGHAEKHQWEDGDGVLKEGDGAWPV